MSLIEQLYLGLVIFAMFAFCATLAWCTYGGKAAPREAMPAKLQERAHAH
jgi:hypothetical protein